MLKGRRVMRSRESGVTTACTERRLQVGEALELKYG